MVIVDANLIRSITAGVNAKLFLIGRGICYQRKFHFTMAYSLVFLFEAGVVGCYAI